MDPEKTVPDEGQPADKESLAKETGAPLNPRSSVSSKTEDIEELREEARRNNPNGLTKVGTGISVEDAEAEFRHLQRELSRTCRQSSKRPEDEEKGTVVTESPSPLASEEQFDLEGVLRGGLEAERQAGIRPKHIGVYWDDMKVRGIGGSTNFVKTFPDSFIDFFDLITPIKKLLGQGKKGVETTLLDGFKGICKPGEMILVLGKPGSGCTTFLRNMANQREGYTAVTGEVLYGPFTAKEFKQYRGEAVYNQEDDLHHATLTVEQTLGFALDVKIPGKRPAGLTKKQFKESVISVLLNMFNISHTKNTVVGGHFVRGISGGQSA
jgi:ATP-binding cassette, subfamily G (WHITE), member 2, SNQ2